MLAWVEGLQRAGSVPCICVAASGDPSLASASLRAGAAACSRPLDGEIAAADLATRTVVPGRALGCRRRAREWRLQEPLRVQLVGDSAADCRVRAMVDACATRRRC